MMFNRLRVSAPLRVAIGVSGLSCSLVLLAATAGLFPDGRQKIIAQRHGFAESMAVCFASMASRANSDEVESTLSKVLERNPSIRSITVTDTMNRPLVSIAQSEGFGQSSNPEDNIKVPVFKSATEQFGEFHVEFTPMDRPGLLGFIQRPEYALTWLFASLGLFCFYIYLRFILRQLNPQRVVPKRVREALDTLAEGLLLLDRNERIVLANSAFEKATGLDSEQLAGQLASTIPFLRDVNRQDTPYPWQTTLNLGTSIQGEMLAFDQGNRTATYSVSSTAVVDDHGARQGAIASFEDVTRLEEQRMHLKQMVSTLKESASAIRRQNSELEYLANRDPLTGCLNRRSFFQKFDEHWNTVQSTKADLSAFMVDIDHFKSINDTYGHAIGDEVLKVVGSTLADTVRATDVVSRYGGEEFAVLLPGASMSIAAEVAEKIRIALQALVFSIDELSITASLGVSTVSLGTQGPEDLLEQADKCLYVAKRGGRNQVVRWDEVPDDIEVDDSKVRRTRAADPASPLLSIPYQAVVALISTLAYRDQETANHCRRVADLCVVLGESLLSTKECYYLEIAAMLHDIGKVGVPDGILQKPGKLTKAEWAVMKNHERVGVQIVETAFGNAQLTDVIRNHRRMFAEGGASIPVGSRILAIADAFDAMTVDRVYKRGVTHEEACAELRRYAGIQFDPELVEAFIERVQRLAEQNTGETMDVVARDVALSIGMQIEHLVSALDDGDAEGIVAVATKLQTVANKYHADSISEKARGVAELDTSDEMTLLESATELLELCRATQKGLLVADESHAM